MAHPGYMVLGDTELLNGARTQAYTRSFIPDSGVKGCTVCYKTRQSAALSSRKTYPGSFYPGLFPSGNLPGADDYIDPVTDSASWWQPERPDTADFYGIYPIKIEGMEDSTHTTDPLELTEGGAIIPPGYHAPREIRVTGMMYAKTEPAMAEGWAWLRDVMDTHRCESGVECAGRQMVFYEYCPSEGEGELAQRVADASRVMYRVEPLEGPILKKEWRRPTYYAAKIEFTLIAGVPWRYTLPLEVGALSGPTTNQVAHVAYPIDEETIYPVLDPTYAQVSVPPLPPVLEPAAAPVPGSWYRYSQEIGTEYTRRPGSGMARVRVTTDSVRRLLRMRFYGNEREDPLADVDGPGWDGEFIVTYMPANSELIIDGALQRAQIYANGIVTPATHLLIGSDGRPFQWPELRCEIPYVMHVDSPVQLDSTVVSLEMSARE